MKIRGFSSSFLKNRVLLCYTLGGDAVVVHPPRTNAPLLEKRINRSKKSLESVEKLCTDHGVSLAIENCHKDDHKILQEYFTLYDPEFIGFCYDSGHANIHGNHESLMNFGTRLKVTHIHDNKGDRDDHQFPGWGTIDWTVVTSWISSLNYNKPLNLEVAYDNKLSQDTMYNYLKRTVNSLKYLS